MKGSQWVGFDNRESYDAKVFHLIIPQQVPQHVSFSLKGIHLFGSQVSYLRSRQLGGAAVWTLDMDDFSGQFCDQGKYPLISNLKSQLIQGEATIKSSCKSLWSPQTCILTVNICLNFGMDYISLCGQSRT